ncbi:MAG: hypothetical protein HY674_09720 [Chloroflexi bacterium]|nr:hypothetical protein [Chloroflexota bacterium]
MKTIAKLALSLAVGAALIILNGCATSEKPNYQGHKGLSPTVDDYYPRKIQQ